jgi:hypothetical protein
MATIIEEVTVSTPPDVAWAALRDFGAVHERLVPGFVTECRMEDGADTGSDAAVPVRVVTFFSGAVAREALVGIDDDARRLAYSVVEGPLGSTHHNASAQVIPTGDGGSRFVWTTDVLPDDLGPVTRGLMQRGIAVIATTLEAAAVAVAAARQPA